MTTTLKSVRGMQDILTDKVPIWRFVEAGISDIFRQYGYQELRMPIIERSELFERSIGTQTDIISKEMYSFLDRNGESITLRPEATASCARVGIEHGLLYNQVQKFWYSGPMFRYERPQRGRYRQFHQCGVEVYGLLGPDIEVELLLLCARIWRELGIGDGLRLELNSLGSVESRAKYRVALVDFLSDHKDRLDEDSLRRLEENPLRILDSKNTEVRTLLEQAPVILDYLDQESAEHFHALCTLLDSVGLYYSTVPTLVRGLDYYGKTVFEWRTDSLGTQDAVCAGGRYDRLVEDLGGHATPAIGFAIGMERVIELVAKLRQGSTEYVSCDIYFVLQSEESVTAGFKLSERLRDELPNLQIMTDCGKVSLKHQLQRANKIGAQIAIILGKEELTKHEVGVKFMLEKRKQVRVGWDYLVDFLKEEVKSSCVL